MRIKLKEHPVLREIVRKAFPHYRKHEVSVHVQGSVTLSGAYWDGGSRSEWWSVQPDGFHVRYAGGHPGFGGPKELDVELNHGFAVVDAGIFMGKNATLSIFVGEHDAERFGIPVKVTA